MHIWSEVFRCNSMFTRTSAMVTTCTCTSGGRCAFAFATTKHLITYRYPLF